jgi:hypothetical protein
VRAFILNLCNRLRLWLNRISEVARWEGIIIADFRNSRRQTPHFRDTILASLALLQRTDPRRLKRVQRHIAWITNSTLPRAGTQYVHAIRTCYMEFQEPSAEFDATYLVGCYACVLVHEATHGVIRSRGILYTPELRERIEQLCVLEEQRFVRRLSTIEPELAARLPYDFDPRDWNWYWHATPFERFSLHITRCFER